MRKWKHLNSRMAFNHPRFRLRQDTVRLPNGKIIDDYFIWLGHDVVMTVPVTRDNKFVLTKQYRYGLDDFIIEFPAGIIEDVEQAEAAGLRELQEETGYTSKEIVPLTIIANNPNRSKAKVHVFLVTNVEKTHDTRFDETESIETLLCSGDELLTMIERGDIWISASVAAGLLSLRKLKKL